MRNNNPTKMKQKYKTNKSLKIGGNCVCPSCGAHFIKNNYQQAFCKTRNKTQIKQRKKIINNFDINSNGINVEFDGILDTQLSQDIWSDNFELINRNVFLFTDGGQYTKGDVEGDNISKVNIIGYCQGDCATIVVMTDSIGGVTSLGDLKLYFRKLFFDTHIGGTITVNGHESYVDEYLDCDYVWDKETFLHNYFTKNKHNDETKREINKLVPIELEVV